MIVILGGFWINRLFSLSFPASAKTGSQLQESEILRHVYYPLEFFAKYIMIVSYAED